MERKLRNALTVRDLIEELQNMPEDAKVLFVCDYGDYAHTQQALPCGEVIEVITADIYESAYSQSGLAARMDDDRDNQEDGDEDPEEQTPIVIIR